MEVLGKLQRNALFMAVNESGLPADDFLYEGVPSLDPGLKDEIYIRHKPSGSQFEIYTEPGASVFTYAWQVGNDPWVSMDIHMNFSVIAEHVSTWAGEVAEWLDAPDLWKSMPDPGAIPGALVPDSANTPFTPDEQAAISAQLKAIAEAVKQNYQLTEEQSAKLDEKFAEADKASQRMGRKDWGTFFGGIALSLVLADIITPDVMGHIFILIEHGIGHLFAAGTSAKHILSEGSLRGSGWACKPPPAGRRRALVLLRGRSWGSDCLLERDALLGPAKRTGVFVPLDRFWVKVGVWLGFAGKE